MPQEEFQALLQFFKVLADENRLKMLGILANGERSVEELAALLQLRAPTVSHHLARLKELGLVRMRADGNTHYYWLDADALRKTNKQILTPERMASLVDDLEGDAWERGVMRDFFDGTRLKEIPASRKKRTVILKWFANLFEYGLLYKEAQVNEMFQRHHEDSAFLRRELISAKEGFMQREGGLYWRIPSGEQWRSVALRSADRLPLQGWLGVPEGNGPFPTIIEIHQGPEITQAEWLSPLSKSWLDQGYAYLVVNAPPTTDSSGLVFPLQVRVAGNPGRWEVEDLVGIRTWLIEQGITQPQHILLTGWSYSGLVTLLALGKYPDLWAGAIAGSVLTDWQMAYEEAQDKVFIQSLFDGTPEEKRDQYSMCSPITYVEQVTAPVLLLQTHKNPLYSAHQAEIYQEKMQSLHKFIELHWLDARSDTRDVELMVEERELMLSFARHLLDKE